MLVTRVHSRKLYRMNSELYTFDGLDNRRDVMLLLQRLSTDLHRARFIESLIPCSLKTFAGCPLRVCGPCDSVTAYFMLVSVCNELGVPISEAVTRLEREVRAEATVGGRSHH